LTVEEQEDDPNYRRSMMFSWAQLLRDRDELVRELNNTISDVGVIRHERDRVNLMLDRIAEVDTLLGQSRFSRAFEKATLLDRAVVGLQSFMQLRLKSFARHLREPVLSLVVLVAAYFLLDRAWPRVVDWLFGQSYFIAPAYAANESINVESAKVVLFGGFGLVLALVFIWFAGVASLSKNSSTRKAAMDFVKSGLTFFGGIVTGIFAKPF
jgi:hypothetical protein